MYTIETITKHAVFHFFQEISAIPRESGNEKQISDYLVTFAKERKLEVIQDEAYNVIIKKPASPGYEAAPTVIIQGHMDMVCEVNKGTIHDFTKDPIAWRIEGDMLYANGTTLGADNGIAVAYALALLDGEAAHPALEVVITTEEETTMGGAIAVNPAYFGGKIFINLDTEEEGKLLVSSSGGVKAKLHIPITWTAPLSHAYRIAISGLRGGHSGLEIHQERGNANKLLGRVLSDLEQPYQISTIHGGLKSNAIPREAEAVIVTDETDLTAHLAKWQTILQNELRVADGNVHVTIEEMTVPTRAFTIEATKAVVAAIVLTPNGVQQMSLDIAGLVESSTNLGVITTEEDVVSFQNEIRSSVRTLKEQTLETIHTLAHTLGGAVETKGDYPAWSYQPDSPIRDLCQRVYATTYQKEAEIIAIHAGIECGVFTGKIPGLDAISLGPDMFDVHTPNEHVSIASTLRTWDYLLAILKEMNTL